MTYRFRAAVRDHAPELLLALILLVAAAVRLWSIRFALPHVYHPDEDALVLPALNIVKTGDLNPLRMDYGSFFVYLMAVVHLLVYLQQARTGRIASVDDLAIPERGWYPAVYPNPEYVLAGRLLSVLFGLAAVVLIYMLATRLGNRRQGLIAAALAAVVPDLVIHSHYAMTDMALATMATLALYLLVRAYDNWGAGSPWPYIGAGFVCGLAASTKFTGALLAAPLLLVPLLRVRRLDDVLSFRVLGGPLAMAAGFLAATPFAVLDLPKFVHYTGYVLRNYNRPGYVGQGATWRWQLDYLFTDRNAALVLPAAAGLLLSLWRWGRRGWIVNSFAVLVLLTASTTSIRETRTWLPVAPIACVWAALALDMLWQWLGRLGRSERAAAFSVVLLLVFLPLVEQTARANRSLAGPDVRTLVADWIHTHVPPGSIIAFDRFPANLNTDGWPVELIFGHYMEDLDWYTERNVRYLVASDVIHSNDRLSAEDMARFRALAGQLCLVQTISGPFLAAPERTYWIYELPPCDSSTE